MDSLQGQLLVASPHLSDPNFLRTVVLMVQHDEDGAVGLILNRPTDRGLEEIWSNEGEPPPANLPIYLGGPVPGPGLVLHTGAVSTENPVIPGVHVTSVDEELQEILSSGAPCRVFSGYSGWGPGQLEEELEVGGWLQAEATDEDVFFEEDEDHWKSVTARIALDIIGPAVSPHRVPHDPNAN